MNSFDVDLDDDFESTGYPFQNFKPKTQNNGKAPNICERMKTNDLTNDKTENAQVLLVSGGWWDGNWLSSTEVSLSTGKNLC